MIEYTVKIIHEWNVPVLANSAEEAEQKAVEIAISNPGNGIVMAKVQAPKENPLS